MHTIRIPVWKPAPFLRLLLSLVIGILLQWYLRLPVAANAFSIIGFSIFFFCFRLLPAATRFRWRIVQGLLLQLVIVAIGALLTFQDDVRNRPSWFGTALQPRDKLLIQLSEPITEKPKSYKAVVQVKALLRADRIIPVQGKLVVYFAKSKAAQQLRYGDVFISGKIPEPLQHSGNPGAFDYVQYAAFQDLFHSVYLKEDEWIKTGGNNGNLFQHFLIASREKVLSALRKYLSSKDELGIAEALLIGYNNDLDKDVLQAYSNTGVVHVIAISGMHLALIYLLLQWIFKRIPFIKSKKILQLIFVLGLLWLFALLTGGSASVLRAAVMFSFISIGAQLSRKASIYNSLAASAFMLLCYEPYYLWDVGFQLSYLAVLGIVIFQKPVYNIFYIKNKWLDQCWKLCSVSLAAQVLTFPVCIYYFHQFPNLFLLANLIVVPLSGLILYVEITLVALSFLPWLPVLLGKLAGALLWLMNQVVFTINRLPWAVWDAIHLSFLSTAILYVIVIAASAWIFQKNKTMLYAALTGSLFFTTLNAWERWVALNRREVIVYNIPGSKAVDIIEGNRYQFIGDSGIDAPGPAYNFHLKPARISLHLEKKSDALLRSTGKALFYYKGNKKLLLLDTALRFQSPIHKLKLDMILLSSNVKISIAELDSVFDCNEYVFDASNAAWRIDSWKKECVLLKKQFFNVPQQGAYRLDTHP